MKDKIVPAKNISVKHDYGRLLADISGIITQGRAVTLRQIDATQVITYWTIGKRIVEFYQKGEHRAVYGEQLLLKLAEDLTAEYGRGFSERNLEMMRMFYLEYPISQTVSAKSVIDFPKALSAKFKLSWVHYCELLNEDNLDARAFYEVEAIDNYFLRFTI